MARYLTPSRPLHFGLEVIDSHLCEVIAFPSESFDGTDELHFYAIPEGMPLDLDFAIHEKSVATSQDPTTVAWETLPLVLTC